MKLSVNQYQLTVIFVTETLDIAWRLRLKKLSIFRRLYVIPFSGKMEGGDK